MSGDGQSRENVQRSGCEAKRSTLKPSILTSVKVTYGKIAVGQAVKVPSPDMFAVLEGALRCVSCVWSKDLRPAT